MIGLLYLENNLTPHVFTPARMAILKLLATEAATSLENTRLYGDLREREARVRRLVDANIVGVLIWISTDRFVRPMTRSSTWCNTIVTISSRVMCGGPT